MEDQIRQTDLYKVCVVMEYHIHHGDEINSSHEWSVLEPRIYCLQTFQPPVSRALSHAQRAFKIFGVIPVVGKKLPFSKFLPLCFILSQHGPKRIPHHDQGIVKVFRIECKVILIFNIGLESSIAPGRQPQVVHRYDAGYVCDWR